MPKTILFLAANPVDTDRLRLDKEVSEIEEGLRRAKRRDNFKLEQSWAVTADSLRRALLDYEPAIVHFSGHGAGNEGIILEDGTGHPALVSTDALDGLFALFPGIECVVLNACYSKSQAEAITKHIDYVVGIEQQIGDEAARRFAVGFYDALGADKSIEFAYKLGCNALQMAGVPDRLAPILLIRPNAPVEQNRPNSNPIGSTVRRRRWLPMAIGIALLILITIIASQMVDYPPIDTAQATAAQPSTDLQDISTTSSPSTLTSLVNTVTSASTTTPLDAQAATTAPSGQDVARLAPLSTATAMPTPPAAINVTNNDHRSIHPQLIADAAGNMHLFWLDNSLRQEDWYDVLHRQRTVDGEWSDVTILTDLYSAYDLGMLLALQDSWRNPCIFFDKLPDGKMRELDGFHMRCLANGSWSEDKLVMEGGVEVQYHPAFASDGTVPMVAQRSGSRLPEFAGNDLSDGYGDAYATQFEIDDAGGYHVFWVQAAGSGLYEVNYRYSNDSGQTWQPIIALSDETSIPDPYLLRSVVDTQGRVHLVWGGYDGNSFYRYWTLNDGWSETVLLLGVDTDSEVGSITVDQSDLVQGVWEGYLGEVLYVQQQTDGSWTARVINAKTGNAELTIAVGGQNIKHFSWVEEDNDIHYAYLP